MDSCKLSLRHFVDEILWSWKNTAGTGSCQSQTDVRCSVASSFWKRTRVNSPSQSLSPTPHPQPPSPTPIPNPQPLVPSAPTLPRHINGGAAGIPCSCSWRCTEASKIALSLPQAAANLGRTWHGGTVGQPIIKDVLPSGKHTKNYGKSPFFMRNSTINGHFQ